MSKTIVVYGSSTGTCEAIAEKIAQKLGCEAIDVQNLTADVVNNNQNLILGTSTSVAANVSMPSVCLSPVRLTSCRPRKTSSSAPCSATTSVHSAKGTVNVRDGALIASTLNRHIRYNENS